MRIQWAPWRSRYRKPVSGISTRLDKAMGDPVVSTVSPALNGRPTRSAPVAAPDPRQNEVERLAQSAFDARRQALRPESRKIVVEPAVPILYFGDRDAYLSSPCRVITVGLNPSDAEFPSEEPFRRFPLAARVDQPNDDYFAALDTYFKTEPNERWFSSFESLLNGLDASYYPGERSTALHTDLCSPVVTNPPWSKLGAEVGDSLTQRGVSLWHELVSEIRPDVILISMARAHLDRIEFESSEPFEISRLEEGRSRPYVTEGRWLDVNGHVSLMVFGQASQLPFGLVNNMHKLGIGGRVASHLRRRDGGSDAPGRRERSLSASI